MEYFKSLAGKNHIINSLALLRCCRIPYLIILLLSVVACHKPKPPVLLDAPIGHVKLEVDSVLRWPELAPFPVRVRLINYTDKKVVLLFDTISNEYKDQVKNFFITNGKDTFNLGVRVSGFPLIFNERTVTSFNCDAYFLAGKGHFDSFEEIESGFQSGNLVYKAGKKLLNTAHLKELHIDADTFLLPSILEVSTGKALLVDRFLPQSYEPIREVKLKQKELRHTTTAKKH
jgi:hypothetical protein